jgi:uncharacterized protein YqhQ
MWAIAAVITGVVVNVCVLVGGLWKLSQISAHVQRTFDYFAREHEILIQDYCKRNNITVGEMATRLPNAPWWSK